MQRAPRCAIACQTMLGLACGFDVGGVRMPGAQISGNPADLAALSDMGSEGLAAPSRVDGGEDITAMPDGPPATDAAAAHPISESAVEASFDAAMVPCVRPDGSLSPNPTKIVDKKNIQFVAGSASLADAHAATLLWVGGLPAVTVVWDPNGCGKADLPLEQEWRTAGLLIRGATLDSQTHLVLEPTVTVLDIDLINVNKAGVFQDDIGQPDDALLALWPPLVESVAKAKSLLVSLAQRSAP